MGEFIWLIVIGSSIWVGFDASSIGVKKGLIKGFGDIGGPVMWFIACILLWIVAFPLYLAKRDEFKRTVNAVDIDPNKMPDFKDREDYEKWKAQKLMEEKNNKS